jgi:Mg-chelatase subunit ChlD
MGVVFEKINGESLSRLDAVKRMFYAFRDHTSEFTEQRGRGLHRLGLLSYSGQNYVHTNPPTDRLKDFEDSIEKMACVGSTATYNAIAHACELLKLPAAEHPEADLRVFCLSDGDDSGKQMAGAKRAANELVKLGAICDCMIVGDVKPDENLLRIVNVSGGKCFHVRIEMMLISCGIPNITSH